MAFENLKSTGIKYVLTKLKDYFLLIADAVKSVNGELPDDDGDISIKTVKFAQNLESEYSHSNYAPFLQRTSGGEGSVTNGDAWLMDIKGANTHEGYVAESIVMTVTAVERANPITATIDRDTFVAYVATSGTTTLAYSSGWTENPALYGITVTGTPVDGDVITVAYVQEVRGEITVPNPTSLISTGWNLYDNSVGYAKVVKYAHGYRIDGTYTDIKFATSLTGTQTSVTVTDGNFDITDDGYIFITGGNSTDTAIYPTWEDWTEEPSGEFEAYTQSVVDFSSVMTAYFPNGLLKAGSSVDEINFNLAQAISRVERLQYNATNLAIAKASGREYEYDEDYIYLARTAEDIAENTHTISVSGAYSVNDHGIEYFTSTALAPECQILYGTNLKNKLERDVLTISQQTLTSAQQSQARSNIGAASQSDLTSLNTKVNRIKSVYSIITATNATSSSAQYYTYSGRKFSDYSKLLFVLYTSAADKSIVRQTLFLPSAIWSTGQNVQLIQNHGANLANISGVQIAYNSDTSVTAYTIGAGSLTGFEIFGYPNE